MTSMLFAQDRNAVQVQRWLGHHSSVFTLATYVHMMDGDLGEPLSLESVKRGANMLYTIRRHRGGRFGGGEPDLRPHTTPHHARSTIIIRVSGVRVPPPALP